MAPAAKRPFKKTFNGYLFFIFLSVIHNRRLCSPEGIHSEHQHVVMHGSESFASSSVVKIPLIRSPNFSLLPF